jgi:lysophospholipase L1-like esterase
MSDQGGADTGNPAPSTGPKPQPTESPGAQAALDAASDGSAIVEPPPAVDATVGIRASTIDALVILVEEVPVDGPTDHFTVDPVGYETQLPDGARDRTADAIAYARDDRGPPLDLSGESALDLPGIEAVPDAPTEQTSQSPVFIASGGGRGPLATTITTDKTSVDVVPTLKGQTVRVMLRTTAAGSAVQIKLTNRYSTDSLPIGAAHVAIRRSGGSIVPDSDRPLFFDGAAAAILAPGTDLLSDPVQLTVARGDTLAISVYVDATLTPTTESGRGNLSWMVHYISQPGDHTASTTMPAATSGPSTTHTILFVSEVRVLAAGPAATLVTLGDSLTECANSTSENGDWPDLLSDRLPALPDGTTVSVFNAGIGSGRFTASDGAGLRGLLRLDDLLQLPNVRWVTILMGVNDISYENVTADELIDAYRAAIDKAHAVGVRVIGIPLLPFKGSKKDVGANWETAEAVNRWIRGESGFDHIIDFQPVLEDPDRPGYLEESLTSDKVHPNQAGYTAMANAIDLSIFR